ncbi:MAG: SRPBCC family protein [Proteobacteria bacterium]|nr:SRPBCC family protein [Pseudomonadota bacterium]
MAEVNVSDEIAAPVADVWKLIRDFGGVGKWGSVEKCEVEGEGVGAVRTLTMPGGLSLQERLESFDEAQHQFSYSILEPCPLPVTGYLSTVTLSAAGDACHIDWNGRFEPNGSVPEDQVKGMVQGIYTGGIKAMKKALGV